MKKITIVCCFLLLCCGAGTRHLQAQSAAVGAMLNAVSADTLMTYDAALERASGYYSRVAFTPGNDSSVQYILRTLRLNPKVTRAGLDTVHVDSTDFGVNAAKPPYDKQPLYNVYAMIPGVKDPMTAVVIGAHLDTYAGKESTWSAQWSSIRAPGADDNGTGVSTVLESARIFGGAAASGYSNDYTLIFVAFNAEEAGVMYPRYLYGSLHFAARLKAEGYKIAAMINIDMTGFNQKLTADIVTDQPSSAIAASAVDANARYGLGLSMNAPPFVYATYSDHSSFWAYGFPAILLIEHAPPNQSSSNYTINTLYHTSHDTLGAVNPVLVKKSAQLAIATAAAYAAPTGSASAVQRLDEQTPHGFQLEQNFPNPFNPSTTLRF
ncbi:MAG TPA: M28 family metallopeptidase, partial [Bacteroidota bacterium]|nr:M28 family metallopeptidase [Bacteroidota bacterium]